MWFYARLARQSRTVKNQWADKTCPPFFWRCSLRFPDRLLNNPWVQPPSAIDWQVQPTYQRRTVPYYLAPLWDSHFAAREQAKSSNGSRKNHNNDGGSDVQYQIPRELRLRLKHARAARGLLRDLEEDIRQFVERYHEKQAVSSQDEQGVELDGDGTQSLLSDEDKWEKLQDKTETETETDKDGEFDSDDDEIVFVGRRGQMHDLRKMNHSNIDGLDKEKDSEKMVFESLEEDRAAGFGFVLLIFAYRIPVPKSPPLSFFLLCPSFYSLSFVSLD